jgi:hypothetical protein
MSNDLEPSQLTPWKVLNSAIKAVPAVRWALGVAGLGAAVAIVAAFTRNNYKVAVFGIIIMFVLMVFLVVFARLTKTSSKDFRTLSLIIAWSFVILVIATALIIFLSFAFRIPRPIDELFGGGAVQAPTATPNTVLASIPTPTTTPGAVNNSNTVSNVSVGDLTLTTKEGRKIKLRKAQIRTDPKTNESIVTVEVSVLAPGYKALVSEPGGNAMHLRTVFPLSATIQVDGKEVKVEASGLGHFKFPALPCNKTVVITVTYSHGQRLTEQHRIECSKTPTEIRLRVPNSTGNEP